MKTKLLEKLAEKSVSPDELYQTVEKDWTLLPELMEGVSSPKASVRYGCAKVLMGMSEVHATELYPFMDSFIYLLDSKYRILVWNALAILANLTGVDTDKKFDASFDKYYSLMNDEYMVTVANVVGNSGKIASAKPYLADRIAIELLKVENLSVTPHLTEECKRVIAEKAIKSFDTFFDKVSQKKRVISFVEKCTDSSRTTLRTTAQDFLNRWTK